MERSAHAEKLHRNRTERKGWGDERKSHMEKKGKAEWEKAQSEGSQKDL